MSYFEVRNISKNYDVKAMAQLHDISFELNQGEIVSIIGPSGTGKSTLLNIISGDESADAGSVTLNGQSLTENDFAYLKSNDELDFTLNVIENIMAGLSGEKDIDAARDMIEVFGLEYKDKKNLSELSAGQLQRVRLAKSVIKMPKLIILDEPFTNLDEFLKKEILNELFEFMKSKNMTGILVTHHLEEAYSLSDRLLILAHGKVIQFDHPEKIYHHPIDVFCARFTGPVNLVASNVLSTTDDSVILKGPYGEYSVKGFVDGKKFAYLAIRPENVLITPEGEVKGRVKSREFLGSTYLYKINTGEKNLILCKANQFIEVGAQLRVTLRNGAFILPI